MTRERHLTFEELRQANATRVRRWHPGGIDDWTPGEWALAMAGEAGETCNAVKKLIRFDSGLTGHNQPKDRQTAVSAIALEVADTVIYADLLMQRLGLNMSYAIIAKFNEVSRREHFPERLYL